MQPLEILILISIFVINFLVSSNVLRTALKYGPGGTILMSICVSLLSVMGIRYFLEGRIVILLIPYVAMAIGILVISLLSFFGKYTKDSKDQFVEHLHKKKNPNPEYRRRNEL